MSVKNGSSFWHIFYNIWQTQQYYLKILISNKNGGNFYIFQQRIIFRPRIWLSEKNRFFGQNFNFRTKFQFLPKLRFWTKNSIFEYNFNFWTKFRFSTSISVFDQNFYLHPDCDFLQKKIRFLTKIRFPPKFRF